MSGGKLLLGAGRNEPPAPPPPTGNFVIGLNVQNYAGFTNTAGRTRILDLGPDLMRIQYSTSLNVTSDINWAASNGIDVLMFAYGGQGINVTTPSGRQAYADRAAGFATQYGAAMPYYEVWNEFNGGIGLGGFPACQPTCSDNVLYTDLLRRTYQAIKAVRPATKVVGIASAGVIYSTIDGVLNAGGGQYMDCLSYHPYISGVPGSSPKPFFVDYNATPVAHALKFLEAAADVRQHCLNLAGREIPLFITEEGRDDRNNSANHAISANYITELYTRAAQVSYIEGVCWFALRDEANNSPGYGLLEEAGVIQKPQYAAYKAIAA